jgi:hypothetical protein
LNMAPRRPSRRTVSAGLLGALAACGAPAEAPATPPASGLRNGPEPAPAFPLRRVEGMRHLVDAADQPFFLHGDVAWAMVAELRREEVDYYLQDRAARGVNAVLTNILEAYNARNAPRNRYGDGPFVGGAVDFGRPNDAYFAHVDHVVRRTRELGMLLLATPAYLGARGVEGGFYQEMKAAGETRLRAYGRYLGQRYAEADNILWVMGGDYTPPERLLVRAVAEGISEGGSRGLKTAHCAPYMSALDGWAGESWLNVNAVYSYGDIAAASRKEFARAEGMPFFMYESYYENSKSFDDTVVDGARMRRQAWEALLNGAFGHMFGSDPLWWFSGPGLDGRPGRDWKAALDTPGARHMMALRGVFRTLHWEKLVPDVEGRFLRGRVEGGPSAAVAGDGSFALVYAPGGERLQLDLGRVAASARPVWIDPTNGDRRPGGRDLSPPGRNGAGDRDWALLVA